MVIIDEYFLSTVGSEFGIDPRLPLRLQKRRLLEALGFPSNPDLKACRARSRKTVRQLWDEYSGYGFPFLIVVSEKPMKTLVPPLFVVHRENAIVWRDDRGVQRKIRQSQALRQLARYSPSTWLEFMPYIWGEQVFAGRMLYENVAQQILEVQQGTIPSRIMNDRELPVFGGEINFMDLERLSYLESARRLASLGYKQVLHFAAVRFVCRALQPHLLGFEKLQRVATRPTLEFALQLSGQLVSIDIDWPAQWINKGG